MVHQSFATRPAVPSRKVPPEIHPEPDVLDVFGSRDNVIRAHFQHVLDLSALAMIAVFTLYAIISKIALTLILEALPFYSIAGDAVAKAIDVRYMIVGHGFWLIFVVAFIAVPLLEILIYQWFPIWLSMKVIPSPVIAVCFSTVLFGAAHLYIEAFGVVTSILVGFFLSVAFLHARQVSWKRACWTTAAIYTSVNGIELTVALILIRLGIQGP
ncbi:MAG: CPBP family intramembrane metalloprotease [Gemmatimonadetes bacterium]|nr:CPBP family intramembrane metalloprotease [Gemmatimonadota bacterium]